MPDEEERREEVNEAIQLGIATHVVCFWFAGAVLSMALRRIVRPCQHEEQTHDPRCGRCGLLPCDFDRGWI